MKCAENASNSIKDNGKKKRVRIEGGKKRKIEIEIATKSGIEIRIAQDVAGMLLLTEGKVVLSKKEVMGTKKNAALDRRPRKGPIEGTLKLGANALVWTLRRQGM